MIYRQDGMTSQSGIPEALDGSLSFMAQVGSLLVMIVIAFFALLAALFLGYKYGRGDSVLHIAVSLITSLMWIIIPIVGTWSAMEYMNAQQEKVHNVTLEHIEQNYALNDIVLEEYAQDGKNRSVVIGSTDGRFLEFSVEYVPEYDAMVPVHGIQDMGTIPLHEGSVVENALSHIHEEGG